MTNQGADMTQPEALRLADDLDHRALHNSYPITMHGLSFAAAELRRLHSENEALRKAKEYAEMVLQVSCNQVALEALRKDTERYRWLLEQAWFQSAFERYDISDDGTIPGFTSECARVIDAAMKGQS
jgi:hypothetical protein